MEKRIESEDLNFEKNSSDNMINDFDLIQSCDVSGFVKEEARAILLYKSKVTEEDVVLDINCGIGELTAEFSNLAKEVIAIDKSPISMDLTKENLKQNGSKENVKLIENDAKNMLEYLDNFDIAILRCDEEELIEELLEKIHKNINSKGRIFIISNLLNIQYTAIEALDKLGYNPQITNISISRGLLLNKGIKMESLNPTAIINHENMTIFTKEIIWKKKSVITATIWNLT